MTPMDLLLDRLVWTCAACGQPTHPPARCPCQAPRLGDVVINDTTGQVHLVMEREGYILRGPRLNLRTEQFTQREYIIYGPLRVMWRKDWPTPAPGQE